MGVADHRVVDRIVVRVDGVDVVAIRHLDRDGDTAERDTRIRRADKLQVEQSRRSVADKFNVEGNRRSVTTGLDAGQVQEVCSGVACNQINGEVFDDILGNLIDESVRERHDSVAARFKLFDVPSRTPCFESEIDIVSFGSGICRPNFECDRLRVLSVGCFVESLAISTSPKDLIVEDVSITCPDDCMKLCIDVLELTEDGIEGSRKTHLPILVCYQDDLLTC